MKELDNMRPVLESLHREAMRLGKDIGLIVNKNGFLYASITTKRDDGSLERIDSVSRWLDNQDGISWDWKEEVSTYD